MNKFFYGFIFLRVSYKMWAIGRNETNPYCVETYNRAFFFVLNYEHMMMNDMAQLRQTYI